MTTMTLKKTNTKSIMIVKIGGSILQEGPAFTALISDLAELHKSGSSTVVVHGGGPAIESKLAQLHQKSENTTASPGTKVNGLRVTDAATLEVVSQVLSALNIYLSEKLSEQKVKSAGFIPQTKTVLFCQKYLELAADSSPIDLGFVGKVTAVDTDSIESALQEGAIALIAPLAIDESGGLYNINADHAALAIAKALKAEKLINLTDVQGLLSNSSDPTSLISKLSITEAESLIQEGKISGGMLPKLQSCLEAIAAGVQSVQIICGKEEHALAKTAAGLYQTGTTISA